MNAKQRRVERRRVMRALQRLAHSLGMVGWTRESVRRDRRMYGNEKFFHRLWRRLEQVGGKAN